MPQDHTKLLQDAYNALEKAKKDIVKRDGQLDEDRKTLITSIGKDLVRVLEPLLSNISENSKINKEEIKQAISESKIQIDVESKAPVINIPDIYVPPIQAPKVTVNVPPIKIPEIKMPKEMDIKGWVQLQGVNLENPLPVQLRDANGKPVNLLENLTTIVGGGSGGGHKIMKVSDIANSAWGSLLTGDGRLKTESASGSSGLTDTELRASSVPVAQVSGASWSTEASQGGNWVFNQVSGAQWSVNVIDIFATTAASTVVNPDNRVKVESVGTQTVSATALDIRALVDPTDSVRVYQLSGANWSVNVTGMPATTIVTGDIYSDVADVDSAPLKTGGIARTANPTAVGAGDRVATTYDDLGRQVTRPIQVRDLIQTAYVAKATGSTFGTETTLLASASGVFSDLIYVMGTNDSDAALTCDFRSATAAGVVFSLRIPANGTAGVSLSVPLPQDIAAATWTIDLPDVTGTNVNISALFSTEV